MNGVDPGQIAQNVTTYLGGAAGGYILAAIMLIVCLLAAAHIVPRGAITVTFFAGVLAWCAAYLVRTTIGWA